MVVRANREEHTSADTFDYARLRRFMKSLQSFFPSANPEFEGTRFIPGHAAPGTFSRAFMEEDSVRRAVENFAALKPGGGLVIVIHIRAAAVLLGISPVSMG